MMAPVAIVGRPETDTAVAAVASIVVADAGVTIASDAVVASPEAVESGMMAGETVSPAEGTRFAQWREQDEARYCS